LSALRGGQDAHVEPLSVVGCWGCVVGTRWRRGIPGPSVNLGVIPVREFQGCRSRV
jgi:hypothetical protein